MKLKFAAIAAFVVLMIPVVSSDAHALTFGALQVRPYLDFSAIYDDNVFVQNSNPTEDYYFLISPGIALNYGRRANRLELEYRADIYRYVDTGDQNDVEDHLLRGGAYLDFPGGLSLKITDLAKRGHEPRSEQNLAVINTAQQDRYWSNDLNAEVAYEISERLKAALAYNYYLIGYTLDSSKFKSRYDNGGGLSMYYRFLPKTSALVQGAYKRVYHYNANLPGEPGLNSDEYWAMAGLTWEITAKSTGTIKGGYEWKLFDDPAIRDFSSPVYFIALDHNFTPKTSMKVSGLRQAHETDDPEVPYYTTTTGSLELAFRPVSKIEVKPYGSIAENRYAGASEIFGDRARRIDTVWAGGITLAYHMNKWLTAGLDYKHTKRSSTITFYDYTDNTVMVLLKASI